MAMHAWQSMQKVSAYCYTVKYDQLTDQIQIAHIVEIHSCMDGMYLLAESNALHLSLHKKFIPEYAISRSQSFGL